MANKFYDNADSFDYVVEGTQHVPTAPATSSQPLTVSQALQHARGALSAVGTLVLAGEVSKVSSNPNYSAVYFDVKDADAVMSCKMWRNKYVDCGIELRVGMNVQLTGKFDIYPKKGTFSFDVFRIEHQGEGQLRAMVHRLAEKLRIEGLMAPERKRRLPEYPMRIGLVTSPAGAAVHDVMRTLRRRFPLAELVFIGVQVEGARAANGMAQALQLLSARNVDVILLVRGGGSFEDLMPFNDETLARTIAAMPVPVVTGIGHENDNTIADLVADYRASTPTAAAEAVSPVASDVLVYLDETQSDITETLTSRISSLDERLTYVSQRPMFKNPSQIYESDAQLIDVCSKRIAYAVPARLSAEKNALASLASRPSVSDPKRGIDAESSVLQRYTERAQLLAAHLAERFGTELSHAAVRLNDLSPLAVLGRGYAIARDDHDRVVHSITEVRTGDTIRVQVSDGRIHAAVTSTEMEPDRLERSADR